MKVLALPMLALTLALTACGAHPMTTSSTANVSKLDAHNPVVMNENNLAGSWQLISDSRSLILNFNRGEVSV